LSSFFVFHYVTSFTLGVIHNIYSIYVPMTILYDFHMYILLVFRHFTILLLYFIPDYSHCLLQCIRWHCILYVQNIMLGNCHSSKIIYLLLSICEHRVFYTAVEYKTDKKWTQDSKFCFFMSDNHDYTQYTYTFKTLRHHTFCHNSIFVYIVLHFFFFI
jgi:hypothetical protein